LNRLSLIIASGLVLLITGLVEPATAELFEPPIEHLMYGVKDEVHGNISVFYDLDGDGLWDSSFLHHKIGKKRLNQFSSRWFNQPSNQQHKAGGYD